MIILFFLCLILRLPLVYCTYVIFMDLHDHETFALVFMKTKEQQLQKQRYFLYLCHFSIFAYHTVHAFKSDGGDGLIYYDVWRKCSVFTILVLWFLPFARLVQKLVYDFPSLFVCPYWNL
jgi:hypothetical protein